jgi:DNA-binding MarR family transcriptional regulator
VLSFLRVPKYRDDEVEELARELMGHIERLTQKLLVPQQSAELSRSETAVLRLLADHGPATMSDISTRLGIAFSSATGVVDRLVERGLVERTRPEEDRRTVRVALTRRGHRAHDAFMADRIAFSREILAALDPGERKTLLALFRKVTEDGGPSPS